MVAGFCHNTHQPPTWHQLKHAILRNFGGLNDVSPINTFENHLGNVVDKSAAQVADTDPDCSPAGLIRVSLAGNTDTESRYLLILTEAYAALDILNQYIGEIGEAITIFGSSFPKDQEYTQVRK